MVEVLEPAAAPLEMDEMDDAPAPLVVKFHPVIQMDDEQFVHFCEQNHPLQIERNADGEIVIMSPENLAGCAGNSLLLYEFTHWARKDGTGEVFGATAGVTLPNTAVRGPDVTWIRKDRLAKLSKQEWGIFPHISPDFVLELWSKSDSLPRLKRKMDEYLANGVRLGWLLDPRRRRVSIYRPGEPVEDLHDPEEVSGDPILTGFRLKPRPVWECLERGL